MKSAVSLLAIVWLLLTCIAHATPPNIIFLLADDLRYDALRCNGNPLVQTPNLDQMAMEGVRFDHFFVTTPICTVSRASILTGLHGRCHGVVGFRDEFRPEFQPFGYPFQLRKAGYWTAFAGKWGVGREVPEGWFDRFEGFWGQGHYFEPGNPRHLDARLADQTIALIDAAPKGRPFCLSISFKSPHADAPVMYPTDPTFASLYQDVIFPCTEKCDTKYFDALPPFVKESKSRQIWMEGYAPPNDTAERIREYHRLVASQDAAIGRIRAALAERDLTQNTVLIYTSDNGHLLGERGLQGKWLPYEESIQVPLIVSGPPLPENLRGTVIHEMAVNIDIAPTLLELAGRRRLPGWQGKSLLPWINGTSDSKLRDGAYFEHTYQPSDHPSWRGIRSAHRKCILYPHYGVAQYFDLAADRTELLDTMPPSGPDLTRLERMIDDYAAALDDWRPDPLAPWQEPFPISHALLNVAASTD